MLKFLIPHAKESGLNSKGLRKHCRTFSWERYHQICSSEPSLGPKCGCLNTRGKTEGRQTTSELGSSCRNPGEFSEELQ